MDVMNKRMRATLLLRRLTLSLIFLCPISAKGSDFVEGESGQTPNILLILLDDFGYGDLGINNQNETSHTPNLDSFAEAGVQFRRHYTDVVCAPSRASLLTGQSAAKLGYRHFPRGISPDRPTLPKTLQAKGYRTHHIGKWLLWSDMDPEPLKNGFSSFFGFVSPFQLSGRQQYRLFDAGQASYDAPWLFTNTTFTQHQGHLNDLLTDNAITKIQEYKNGAPWFINLWTLAPHLPIQPAERVAKLYPDTPTGRYLALLHQLDENIGRVLRALDDTNQADDTIVVILSDNGGTNFTHNNNLPLKGQKGQFLEGSNRTPLLWRWPARLPSGIVVNEMVALQDIFPTLAMAVGAEIPAGLDGRNILPVVSGEPIPKSPLYWEKYTDEGYYAFGVLDQDGRWRLTSSTPGLLKFKSPSLPVVELYDLKLDPGGHTDVAGKNPDKVNELVTQYQNWHKKTRRLDVQIEPADGAVYAVRGDNYQRTPGHGGFTFAIGIQSTGSPSGVEIPVALHKGLWTLHLSNRDTVQLKVGKQKILGQLASERECHSLVFTSFFRDYLSTSNTGPKPRSLIGLYVDGELQQEISSNTAIPSKHALHYPTLVGPDPAATYLHFSRPILLNTHITPFTPIQIADLDREVCPGEKLSLLNARSY